MGKVQKFLILLIVTLLLASCATTQKYLYYYETDQKTSINSTLPLVSIQLSGREHSWTESTGYKRNTTYIFSFENANKFAKMIFNYIPLNELGVEIPSNLQEGKVNLKNYTTEIATIRNVSYDWGIPVVDELNNPEQMDSDVLQCLNENINSKYYLVIDADILKMQLPKWFGLIPFSLVYEFSVVVYNNEGKKTLSKNYRYKTVNVPGSIYDVESYYKGLDIALKHVKNNLVKDIKNLKATPIQKEEINAGDKV